MVDSQFRRGPSGAPITYPSADSGKVIAVGANGQLNPSAAAALLAYPSSDDGCVLTVQSDGSVEPNRLSLQSAAGFPRLDALSSVLMNCLPAGEAAALLDAGKAPAAPAQAVAGNRAQVVQAGDRRVLRNVRATPTYYTAAYQRIGVASSVWSVLSRMQPVSIGIDQCVLGLSGAGSILAQHYIDSSNHAVLWVRDAGGVTVALGDAYSVQANDDLTVAWIMNGSASAVVVNGLASVGALTGLTHPIAFTHACWGAATQAGANAFDGDIWGVQAFGHALSPSDYINGYRLLNGHWPLRVICDGNSLTAGQGASGPAFYYPAQLAALLGAEQLLTSNIGVGAAQTSGRIAAFAAEAFPLCESYSTMVAIPWEFTNTIYYGADAATTIDQALAWIGQYRAAGNLIVLVDIIARSSFTPGQRAIASDVNAYFAGHWREFADAFVPASLVFSDYSGPLYSVDGIHLNDLGYARLAELNAVAVRAVLNQPDALQSFAT